MAAARSERHNVCFLEIGSFLYRGTIRVVWPFSRTMQIQFIQKAFVKLVI